MTYEAAADVRARGNNPPPRDEPPGLPSLRGNRGDGAVSVSASTSTAVEQPRVSRREADKVFVHPWPKHQNLGVWSSDPALQPNADLDALNDSGRNRYQSIDAKLSIALSNVISQAGDVARHVAVKL